MRAAAVAAIVAPQDGRAQLARGRALAALAQETRLDVFRLLVRNGLPGLPAGRIADLLDLAPATLSFHLKELRSAGLVICQREGRSRIYRPDFQAMGRLVDFLTDSCCQGVPG